MSLADRPSQSITEFIARLKQDAGLDLNAAEIANILWLAIAIEKVAPSTTEDVLPIEIEPSGVEVVEVRTESTPASPPASLPQIPLVTELPLVTEPGRRSGALPISVPDSSALPQSLQLGRSLRPLMRKERSRSRLVLDEEATVVQIAEESIWSPVMQPAPERWLELAIVVEATDVLEVWQDTITEFQHLMERQGAFRDVRSWQLIGNEVGDRTRDDWGTAQLFRRGSTGQVDRTQPRKPKELLDPMGRRLILFVSDCTSDGWRSGRVSQLLAQWMEQNPVTILQLLPERFWERSALGLGDSVWLRATLPGMLNDRLGVEGLSRRRARSLQKPLSLPIITLDPQPLLQWAKVMAGFGAQSTAGVVLEMEAIAPSLPTEETVATEAVVLEPLTAEQLVRRFRGTASPIARQLAEMMAAVPVSWSVIRLIQRTLLPKAKTEHVAEIFLSGLLCPATIHEGSKGLRRGYEFVGGVRDSLIRAVPIAETEWVMEEVADDVLERLPLDVQRQLSEAIARQFGASARSFSAFLLTDLLNDLPIDPSVRAEFVPFATVTSQVLQRLGREYAVLAQAIDTAPLSTLTEFPPVQTLEFITVQLSDSGDNDSDTAPSPFQLQTEQFTVATL
ncbi:MAG: formylglycine-generating enzyme family protein, partial [Phormidesmis sp. CAN_BIN36]|nr:formylglycine-generating enzyme family protein [Phormidesmis sp. CAN_BIN36]